MDKFESLISTFGAEAQKRLSSMVPVRPEEQLRAPIEILIPGIAELCTMPGGRFAR